MSNHAHKGDYATPQRVDYAAGTALNVQECTYTRAHSLEQRAFLLQQVFLLQQAFLQGVGGKRAL